MRQIKFRGKRLDKGEWVYGYLLALSTGESHILTPNYEKKEFKNYNVVPETVGQFTGLTDKNDKEIYEGDIFGIPQELPNRHIRVVEFIDDGFFLIDNCDGRKYGGRLKKEISTDTNYAGIAKSLAGIGFDYELIGNIHDNHELLKGCAG